ncbi:hypothetical protein DICPUDRAFT_150360 [Dictyostelium purpureum]|uniref:Uncharacterized protein n=1 Tax=Dictyostelium purpureum TaxID=5786 RepID=F0ZG47_DICPU|nr:uncharacterized protein DICPUDRAFT_150360 [Dictyostelium purpureum]EGC37098.1 hypothetical protein DICPUDRAFT_150360 [Dictyostelium purpureum]|eukprot:XP_003286379.1 hypothetical protein DICPUDRAFT_150360 [Dictyostelium purpureum]
MKLKIRESFCKKYGYQNLSKENVTLQSNLHQKNSDKDKSSKSNDWAWDIYYLIYPEHYRE